MDVKQHKSATIIPSICGVCPAGCGVHVHLVNERIESITPIKDHPQGIVCPRGIHAKEIVYSKDRYLYPQKKQDHLFQNISWDEAYKLMVSNLTTIAEKYGPEAVCIYTGRGNFEFGLNEMFAPEGPPESSANAVLFPFGSPNTTGVGSLCYVSYGMIASRACFGAHMHDMKEDTENASLIVIWGANPITDSSPIKFSEIKKAQQSGAKVVIIDHRKSEVAIATRGEWIGIRPGTDGALALSMINVLIKENLFDHDFVKHWVHGFPELETYIGAFSPEEAEKITYVPAEKIKKLAREIAHAKGCAILTYTGLEYSNSGVQAIRAVWILQALAGHLDTPGGKLFKSQNRLSTNRLVTPSPKNAKPPIGKKEYPIYHEVRNEAHAALLPKAILEGNPYPIRALIVSGSSILTAWPNPNLWEKALSSLDYLVIINRFPTADAKFADLILPAATGFEIESYMVYDSYIQHRQRVIPPIGEARNDYLIFSELANRLGYGDHWPQTEADMIRFALNGTGITYEELVSNPQGIALKNPEPKYQKYRLGMLRADRKAGFETPTGKFEITSEWLRGYGYDALPVYTEPLESPISAPKLAKNYPLVLNTGARTQFAFRSQHYNIPSLISKQPEPHVYLNLIDAEIRGIKTGDSVQVVTPRGRVLFRAVVTDKIIGGVVEANMGGGSPIAPRAWREANVNILTDLDNRDPISGFPVYKALLCDVKRL